MGAIGGNAIGVHHFAFGMGTLGFAVQICADQFCTLGIAGGEEDAVVRSTKMRRFTVARDAGGRTAARCHPIDAGFS